MKKVASTTQPINLGLDRRNGDDTAFNIIWSGAEARDEVPLRPTTRVSSRIHTETFSVRATPYTAFDIIWSRAEARDEVPNSLTAGAASRIHAAAVSVRAVAMEAALDIPWVIRTTVVDIESEEFVAVGCVFTGTRNNTARGPVVAIATH